MVEVSKSEWEVMRVIWAGGSVTSRQVIGHLKAKQNWSDSTVKTLLGRLVAKEMLVSQDEGRSFVYQALVSEQVLLERELDDLLERMCQKKQTSLVSYLLKKVPLTETSWKGLEQVLKERGQDLMATVPCCCVKGQCACSDHFGEEDFDEKTLSY